MDQNSGEIKYPGIFETFVYCLRLVFFSEKAFFRFYIDNRLNYNLITIFLLTLLIPYKSAESDGIYNLQNIVNGLFMTFFFILFLYLLIPKKKISLLFFIKLFLPLEVINIFAPITFLLSKDYIHYFGIFLLSWYLSLSVFIYSRITGLRYFWGSLFVLLGFFLSNLMIALF